MEIILVIRIPAEEILLPAGGAAVRAEPIRQQTDRKAWEKRQAAAAGTGVKRNVI
jgi:hypothetical protein